jgi:hypothetical protein
MPLRLALPTILLALLLSLPGTSAAHHRQHREAPELVDPYEQEWEDEVPAEDDPAAEAPPALPEPVDELAEPEPFVEPVPAPELEAVAPLVTTATVPGRTALMRRDGKAAIPRGAPKRVRAVIAAANQIVGKPYKWGGGHARLLDKGYDCSGAVSFALIRAGLLPAPRVSGALARWAAPGAGRWLTVHANRGHVYLEVAGLRLDTSRVGDRGGRSGVRWRPVIGRRPAFTSRHVAGL